MKALDEVFDLLSRERRRYALYYLERQDGPVPVEDLAATIAEWEAGGEANGSPGDEYDDVIISLEHNHLPKIEGADFIEYDRAGRQLELSGTASELRVVLSVAKAIEQPEQDDIAYLGNLL